MSSFARLVGREQVLDDSVNVEFDDLVDFEQFDNVNPATAALDLRDDGLVAAEFRREFGLAQPDAIALLDDQVDEADVSR